MKSIYQAGKLTKMAKALYQEERKIKRLDGWFLAKETEMLHNNKYSDYTEEVKKAYLLCEEETEFKVFRLGKRCLRIHKESFDEWFNGLIG